MVPRVGANHAPVRNLVRCRGDRRADVRRPRRLLHASASHHTPRSHGHNKIVPAPKLSKLRGSLHEAKNEGSE